MGNYHKVDKGELFIEEGMTLITEVDSDKYLNRSKNRKITTENEEIFPIEDNYSDCIAD